MTVYDLVDAFLPYGVSLEVNVRKCEDPDSSNPDATNLGPTGLRRDIDTAREEGDVFCDLRPSGEWTEVRTVRHPTDYETYVDALNIVCAIYPWNEESRASQVARVERALEQLVRGKRGS